MFLPPKAWGQGTYTFTSDHGLTNSSIRYIYQDSRHNVWICTRNGLNRYDGAKINKYHHKADDPTSLSHNLTTSVLEYDSRHVLVGTEMGVQSYNYATNKFTEIPIISLAGDTVHRHVSSMAKLHDGSVHLCMSGYGSCVVQTDAEGRLYAKEVSTYLGGGMSVVQIVEDGKNQLWVVDNKSEVHRMVDGKLRRVSGASSVVKLCRGVSGDIYAGTDNKGILKYSAREDRFVSIDLGIDNAYIIIKSIRSDGKGNLLVSTDGKGLFIYNEKTHDFKPSNIRTSEYDLSQSNVEDAMVDAEGNLWVCVYWKGVVVQPRVSSAFEYVGRRSAVKNTLGTNSITAISPGSAGSVWVATDHSGLYRMTPDGASSVHFSPETYQGIPSTIKTIYEDKSGKLWLGSSIGGLVCMSSEGVFTPFSSIVEGGGKVQKIFDICEDDYGRLWLATMSYGIFCYDPVKKSIEQYTEMKEGRDIYPYNIIVNRWVSCVATNGDRLYIGTADGVEIYAIKADGKLKKLSRSLVRNGINDIKIARDGSLWIASSLGLCHLQADGKVLHSYTTTDGLPDDMVKSIELSRSTDGTDLIWASTDGGLTCFNVKSESFSNYFYTDGLQGNEFLDGVSAHIGETLYFGGINGLNYFRSSDVERGQGTSSLDFRIVDFYLFGSPVYAGQKSGSYDILTDWVAESQEANLAYYDNSFSIELSTMHFLQQHVIYEYRLNGGEWISIGEGQNRISFTNMPSGRYDISIRAVAQNVQSEERHFIVVIHPAWYVSPWAYVVYVLLLLAICYVVYMQIKERVAARRVLRRHQQEEELAEARVQFFMNISHEIRTPMTLILAPLEKLKKMDDDAEHQRNYNLIYQNAHRILRLINQLMDVRKIEKGQFSLEYSKINLVDFVQNLHDLFVAMASRRDINFSFVHSFDNLDVYVDSQSLDKMIMNLLSNAFKFTPDGGSITVETLVDDSESPSTARNFTIKVTDSGIGIPDADKTRVFERFYSAKHQNGYIGTGIGLNLTSLLVSLHGGTINVEDNPSGTGTCFSITLPIGDSSLVLDKYKGNDKETAISSKELASDTSSASSEVAQTALPIDKVAGLRHRNVLVCEDDAAIREYIHSELSSDFVIKECSNGKEGWDYVIKNPQKVDLIISDVMMPVMEGTTLCQNVKSNYNTSHIPVILLTAKSTDADRIAGISIGADAYITKPFNVEILRTTALQLLITRQQLQGKYVMAKKAEEKIDKVEVESPDDMLMSRIMKVINSNMDNPDLSVEFVADKVGVSRVHFHRKVKELTGQTPRDYIKTIRLKQAARLLSEKRLDITDVSYAVGFRSLSTFSTSFKNMYGMSPSEYMNKKEA